MNAKHDTVDRTKGVTIASDFFGMTYLVVDQTVERGDRPAVTLDFDGHWWVETVGNCPLCLRSHLERLSREFPETPVVMKCRSTGSEYEVDVIGVRQNVLDEMRVSFLYRDHVLNMLPRLRAFL